MIYGLTAIIAGLFFIYKLIAGLIEQHRIVQIAKANAEEQDEFNQTVAESTKEIKNAELDYQAARKQFSADTRDSQSGSVPKDAG